MLLLAAEGRLNPDLVAAVAAFRGEVYSRDGVAIDELDDLHCWHIAILRDGLVDGCVRYRRMGRGLAHIGGWAVREARRGSRDAVRLALRCVQLAAELGDGRGLATATVRYGSADILERLGGRVLARYYDAAYRSEMVSIEFRLAEMRGRAIPLLAA